MFAKSNSDIAISTLAMVACTFFGIAAAGPTPARTNYDSLEVLQSRVTYHKMNGQWLATEGNGYDVVAPGKMIVRIKRGVTDDQVQATLTNHLNRVAITTEEIPGGYRTITFPESLDVIDALDKVRSTGLFAYAYPSVLATPLFDPNDAHYQNDDQWHLTKIEMPRAWDISKGSDAVRVGVFDSGVERTHADLSGNYNTSADYDYFEADAEPQLFATSYYGYPVSDRTHGTKVLGVISAMTNNNQTGVAGVAGGDWSTSTRGVWGVMYNTDYLSWNSSTWSWDPKGDEGYWISALNSAPSRGINVVNISYGGRTYLASLQDAITNATSNGVLVVASSGNWDGSIAVTYPGKYYGVVCVGNSASDDTRYSSSCYGPELDVMAPGVGIWTTTIGGGYDNPTGTSFAAPQVAAVAGLIKSVNGSLTPAQIEEIICTTTDKVGGTYGYGYPSYPYGKWDTYMGYGRLNAYRALVAAQTGTIHITSDLTWYGRETPVYGSIVVDAGVTMTVAAGAGLEIYGSLTVNGSFVAQNDAEVIGNNDITINGTMTAGSSSIIKFMGDRKLIVNGTLSASGSTFTAYNTGSPWTGIYTATASSSISLTNCIVSYASKGIHCNYNNGTNRPTVVVSGGEVHHCTDGIYLVQANNNSYIENCSIHGNISTGIYVDLCNIRIGKTTNSTPRSNTIYDNGDINDVGGGIRMHNADGEIRANTIYNNGRWYSPNIWLTTWADPNIEYNNIYYEPSFDRGVEYNLICDASYPWILQKNWFYGAETAEIRIENVDGAWLDYGQNNLHSDQSHDNGNNPTGSGRALWAISWGYNSTGDLVYAANNWWGSSSPTWNQILTNTFMFYGSALGSPSRSFSARPARDAAMPADVALLMDGVDAVSNGDAQGGEGLLTDFLARYPESPRAAWAVRKLFTAMANREASQAEMEEFFGRQATRALHPLARKAAGDMRRKAMAWNGDFDRAADEYRSVAEDAAEDPGRRMASWYEVAYLSNRVGDTNARNNAVAQLRSLGGDDARLVALAQMNWPDAWTDAQASPTDSSAALSAEPNPFNPSTTITYRVDAAGAVRVGIYAVSGQLIRTLVSETREPGTHTIVWDGNDASGRAVASGVYLVRFMTPTQTATHRVTMVR